jgi:hypothetical protein
MKTKTKHTNNKKSKTKNKSKQFLIFVTISGYGKMKINDDVQLSDFRSLCALHGEYITGFISSHLGEKRKKKYCTYY